MLSLFTWLFLLRVGSVPATHASAELSVRAEARKVAHDALLTPAALTDAAAPWSASPGSPMWAWSASAHVPGAPVFPIYRPEEFVAFVVSKLHVSDTRIGQAAIWLANSPVRVDASPNHVYVSVRVRGP
jgi:hypothetical protein